MKTHLWVSILLLVFFASGCTTITPKTAALQQVHRAYAEDFAQFSLPPAGDKPAAKNASAGPAFTRTLQEIRAYRINFPGSTSAESAHLDVLEGMIYLQSGRSGLASAIAPDVKAAAGKLTSGTGKIVRDRLFAENFADLIVGWTEIGDSQDESDDTKPDWTELRKAAENISKNIQSHATELADADADQGALYLANTAAIFYVWAGALNTPATPGNRAELRRWLSDSRDLMGRFLTETEKKPKAAEGLGDAPGRLRYISWYHWLNAKIATLPSS